MNELRLAGARDAERISIICADILESGALFAIDKINRRRHVQVFDVDARRGMPHTDQPVGLGVWQRLQQHAFQDAEDHNVRANPRGERNQRDGGKHRRAAEPAQNLPKLIGERSHDSGPPHWGVHSRLACNQPRLRDAVLQANTSAGGEMFRRNAAKDDAGY